MSQDSNLIEKQKHTMKKMKELVKSEDHSPVVLIPKRFISQEPPFEPDFHFTHYTSASFEDRRRHIRSSCKIVNEDELAKKISFHYEVEEKIHGDPELHRNVEIFPRAEADTKLTSVCGVLCKRALMSQGRDKDVRMLKAKVFEINDETKKQLLKYHPTYTPPKQRILMMPNLTFNTKEVIPVYSDIPNEKLNRIKVPDELLFDYTDVNFVNRSTELDLGRAVEMAQEPENTIRCDCCSNESIVSCYDNPNCKCFLLNDAMQDFQPDKDEKTKFTTFEPIYLTGSEEMYGKHYGFSCSELCACKGNCTNNTMLIIEKKVFPLEVFRKEMKMGFSVRSPVLIPGGTPIMEFAGEICRYDNESSDYSYQISYDEDQDIIKLFDTLCFTGPYKKLLKKLHKQKWYIDPKFYGNVARMACHSCNANMELFRVFQKSLSPAHIRLVLVAMLDIYPGTPLTFDYGHDYVEQHFGKKCRCGSFVCKNGADAKIYTKLNEDEFQKCFIEQDNEQWKDWDETVYQQVWDDRDRIKRETEEKARSENRDDDDVICLD